MTQPGSKTVAATAPRHRRLLGGEEGATSLEWALLLGAIAIPSYLIIRTALNSLVGYYAMMTTLNALPFP